MSKTINEIAQSNGYSESGNIYWREVEGYLLNLYKINDKLILNVSSGLENELMPMAVGEGLASIAKKSFVNDCLIIGSSVELSFIEGDMNALEVEDYTQIIIELLKVNRIETVTKCSICHEEIEHGNEALIKAKGRIIKSHKSCFYDMEEKLELMKYESTGSYVTGAVGALLFGVVGTIPWIIVGLLGWFASILGMVIGVSANYGYNLFKGKQGKLKPYIMIVSVVLMVVFATFVTELYSLFEYLRESQIEGVSLIDGIRFIIELVKQDSEYRSSFMINLILGLAFAVFGAWKVIKSSGQQNTPNKVIVELVQ